MKIQQQLKGPTFSASQLVAWLRQRFLKCVYVNEAPETDNI